MRADLVAQDREGNPVLIAEIKAYPADEPAVRQLLSDLEAADPATPFGMLVDPQTISLYERSGDHSSAPVLQLMTADVLRHYDPEFAGERPRVGNAQFFRDYLGALVEAWLRDLAFRWKSEQPPATKELEDVGLLRRLEEGTTTDEVSLGDPLH